MRSVHLFVVGTCLLVLPSPLAAQEADVSAAQDPRSICEGLSRQYRQAVASYWRDREVKLAAGERPLKPRAALKPLTDRVLAETHRHAVRHAGKDEAIPFLGFLVEVGGEAAAIFSLAAKECEMVQSAIDVLARAHRGSPAIGDVISDRLYSIARTYDREAVVIKLIDWVADQHTVPSCRAEALLGRGIRRVRDGDVDSGLRDLSSVLLVTTDADLTAEAKQEIREIERFSIGAVAPEIVGVDTDGVSFKLSDYRGKVVLLDFWGFW